MTKQLERIYLLNVLLYIPTLESITKFTQINKKCKEVSEMVRLYTPKIKIDEEYKHKIYNKIIPKDLLTIYPTIETIECNNKQLVKPELRELFQQVKIIKLKIEFDTPMYEIEKLPIEIREKVVYCDAVYILKKSEVKSIPNLLYVS